MIRLFPSGSKKSKDKRDWNNCKCSSKAVSYTHLRAHETLSDRVLSILI